jgi:succinyl-diaminopimelate desuccinylase
VTTIDTGNAASNVIPARTRMTVNIRFNDLHTGNGLVDWLRGEAARVAEASGTTISTDVHVSGEAFLTPPGPLSETVAHAVRQSRACAGTVDHGGNLGRSFRQEPLPGG